MKKFTLFLVATLFSALSFAALNPYAYGLSSDLSNDEKTVTITYKLNAPATAVSVVVLDGETVLKTQSSTGITQGEHSVAISTDGFPKGKTLTWKVVVNGNSVANPTLHDESIRFYLPYGMDIDVDPESDYMGNWYVIESSSATKGVDKYKTYQSYNVGRGLYAFDPTLTPVKNSAGTTGFTGGANVGYLATDININNDKLNFYRVTTSGGRVFIGRFRDGDAYHPIIEANPADLNADFTSVFTTGRAVSIDAIGSGENLKLVMLAKDNNIYEYDLGNAKSIAAASRTINKGSLSILRDDATITYDNNGGIWFNQNRGDANEDSPTIAHLTASGVDYNNAKAGLTHNNTNNSGIAVSPDGKQLAVVGAGSKNITIYNINNAGGNITLTKAYSFAVSAGNNHTALAWDYAGNLFAANRSEERIRIFAMPYSGTVSTPCASKHAFSLKADPQLNPFAYNLSSELSADEKNLTINYSLNAKATSVEWVLMDGTSVVKTVDLASLGLEKGDYTTTISTTDFPQYKQLTWKIEVKGVAVSEPTEYPVSYDFYHPSSVDIDNNPENPTFGLILCNEAMQSVKGKKQTDTGEDYLSSSLGAGIYAFNPAFENTGKYNGGITFTTTRADGTGTAYAPRRIRISEDGRIFVTSLNTDGNYLWEVDPENMNEWTPVFKGTLNTNKELVDEGSNFVAAPNIGFDVRGEGANLKLLMLSANLRGFPSTIAASAFKCHEYNLGTATTWSTTPSKTILSGKYMINYTGDQVVYDAEGGVWFCQHQLTATEDYPSLVHINKNGVEDYKEVVNNRMAGGFRFNNDFTKVVIAGIADGTKNSKKATVYAVSKDANGKPVLTEETIIDMKTVGNNLNDFSWDYAGNLYACGNSSEKLVAWAMPHSSEDVVATPAASKYAFSIGKYTVTVNTNDVNKGTVTGGGEYGAGAVLTLTATPKEGYELLYWSDRSKENPRNITVDGNEAFSAYFIKKNDVEPTFSITKVWENTNVPASTGNGFQAVGWDQKIYMQDAGNKKIMTFTKETGNATEYAASGSGQQIAVDEVGNLIVFNAYFATATPGSVLIYQKGSTTGKVVNFTLPNPARCDFFSASGNIFSAEGGYVYFYCNGKQVINRLKITNGAATAADVMTDIVGGSIYETTMNQNHVMVDIFGNLVTHARANALNTINVYTNEVAVFTNLLSGIKTTTLGGCSFELGGKELWAYNVGTTNFNSEWNIYNITDTKILSNEALYINDKTLIGSAANWLNVQVVDEKTAYIYQFCPKVGAAVWKVARDHIVTATAENGTVTGAGTYKDNATATLTATPNDGYLFKNWTKNGEVVSTENPYSFTVTEDVELVANFDGPFCELILNTNDEAKGTVEGAGFYNVGQTVTIKATPEAGYKLLYWSDRSTQATRTITMNKKEALSAYFVKDYAAEPTFAIEKVWENTNVPASANNGFQAVGWDQKIYMKDRLGAAINVYTEDDSEIYVNTDAFTSEEPLKGDQPIAIDDAGNIVIRSGSGLFYNPPTQVTIYKNGNKTGKVIDFTLPATGRCDFISASGDIYSTEGGYVYFYCQNQTTVSRLYIKNGGASAADISVDEVGVNLTAGSSQSHVFTNIFGDLMTHTRDNNYKVLQEVNVATGAAITMNLPNFKNSTLGGCSFELGGKELIAYNIKGTDYNSEWNLYNMTDGEFLSDETLYAKDRISKKNSGAANWLNVQVVDENTAYIYQFCPEVAVAMWKVSINRTDLQEFTVTASANDPTMGTVTGGGTYYEGATAILTATANTGYRFVNWTKDETILSTDASFTYTVPAENVTIVANFEALPTITYELNGGVWNKYGWTSKKDMYDAFIADWKAYSGSTRATKTYEEQYGIGKSNGGIPTTIQGTEDVLGFMSQEKWAWLGQFLDALATAQGKATKPTEAVLQMRYGLGNFFGEDNNGSTTWHGAVDCSAGQAKPEAFQPIWGQSLPHPIQPTTTVVLGNPYKEDYLFEGWYAASDFSGAEVTIVDETTNGTLYAKWIETIITVTIGEDVDNTTNLAPHVGKKVTATVTRYFGVNKILTVTLPFDMSAAQISTHFGNATVYKFYNVVDAGEELHLQFSRTTSIEAGKPYIIQTAASGYEAENGFTIENVTINTDLTHVEIGGITMVPVLDGGGTLDKETQYYLSNNALYCAGEHNQPLPGLRAFFTSATSTPIRARVIFDDNEATSIPTVIAPKTKAQKIIKDGRLIIIRGEHQYNAQGQMIE